MKPDNKNYDNAKNMTAMSLNKLIETTEQLTHLSLPERSALVEEISRVLPAGNVPSLVAAGLANLPGRTVSTADSRRNLSLLMQGMQTFLDKAVFQTFFVGPATLLSAYQMLLKLAGKDIEQSFPEGTWQFYVEFGLREDSGRHACETVGFRSALEADHIKLSASDELACWFAASAWVLDRYQDLLTNEWTEHIKLSHIEKFTGDRSITNRWVKSRPYSVPNGINIEFAEYRHAAFDAFYSGALSDLNPRLRKKIEDAWIDPANIASRDIDFTNYLKQMSVLATLQPTEHSDMRVPLSRNQLCIAVVSGGRYYMVDIGGDASIERARPICAAILKDKPDIPTATLDKLLTTAHRRDHVALRKMLPDFLKAEVERLRSAPIILNWDVAPVNESLMAIRSGRRGIGDQAMTVFRTTESTVFDLSHIFFDGPWGMAIAEILTGQAIRFAREIAHASKVTTLPAVHCLDLEAPGGFSSQAKKAQLQPEVSGETTLVNLKLIQQVRDNLRRRNVKMLLTVNDVLILFRSIFNQLYQPSTELTQALHNLASSKDARSAQAGSLALSILEETRQINPALLIPIDASSVNPRERIYPTTFRNPFNNILKQHRQALSTLETLESANMFMKPLAYRAFEDARRDYLSTLYAFGQVIARYKDVSLAGESVSTATIKLLAGLPQSVQRMLDMLPGTFDVVNDVVKGQEVFSNVGRVSGSSSLRRFNTAKDDNEKKVLAWGVLTDAKEVVYVSLRDSRPHVAALVAAKQQALAEQMAQEFVTAYAALLNQFLEELVKITRARHQPD